MLKKPIILNSNFEPHEYLICPSKDCLKVPKLYYSYNPLKQDIQYECICQNQKQNMNIKEFLEKSNIICHSCKNIIKEEKFFICSDCHVIIEENCKIAHKHLNFTLKNINQLINFCKEDNSLIICRCENCNESVCLRCYDNHDEKGHLLKQMSQYFLNQNEFDKINNAFVMQKTILNEIKNINNKLISYFENDLKIKQKIIDNFQDGKRNYNSILNIKNLNVTNIEKYEIKIKNILTKGNEGKNNGNDLDAFLDEILLIFYYSMMINKDESFSKSLLDNIFQKIKNLKEFEKQNNNYFENNDNNHNVNNHNNNINNNHNNNTIKDNNDNNDNNNEDNNNNNNDNYKDNNDDNKDNNNNDNDNSDNNNHNFNNKFPLYLNNNNIINNIHSNKCTKNTNNIQLSDNTTEDFNKQKTKNFEKNNDDIVVSKNNLINEEYFQNSNENNIIKKKNITNEPTNILHNYKNEIKKTKKSKKEILIKFNRKKEKIIIDESSYEESEEVKDNDKKNNKNKKEEDNNFISIMIALKSGNFAISDNRKIKIYDFRKFDYSKKSIIYNDDLKNENNCLLQTIYFTNNSKGKFISSIFQFPDETLLCSVYSQIIRINLTNNDENHEIIGCIKLEELELTRKLISLGKSLLVVLSNKEEDCYIKIYNQIDFGKDNINKINKIEILQPKNINDENEDINNNKNILNIKEDPYFEILIKNFNQKEQLWVTIFEIEKDLNEKIEDNYDINFNKYLYEFIATSNAELAHGKDKLIFYGIIKDDTGQYHISTIKEIDNLSCSEEPNSICQINKKYVCIGLQSYDKPNIPNQINGFALINIFTRTIYKIIEDKPINSLYYYKEKNLLFASMEIIIKRYRYYYTKIYQINKNKGNNENDEIKFNQIYEHENKQFDTITSIHKIPDKNFIFITSSLNADLEIVKAEIK